MSLSRSKRSAKPIKYFVPENDSSEDDDFCDFTPPSKKIKELSKKKKSKRNIEIDETLTSFDSPKDKCPKQRLSLEERKFQRELELALELSNAKVEPFPGFNKKSDGKENELEFFSPLRTTVVDVEVHQNPNSGDENVASNKNGKDEILNERIGNCINNSKPENVDIICIKNANVEVEKLDDIKQITSEAEKDAKIEVQKLDDSSEISNGTEKDMAIEMEKLDYSEQIPNETEKEAKIEVEKLEDFKNISDGTKTTSRSRLKSNNNISTESANSDNDIQKPKERKKRKKVNFIDDESDGFSDNDIEESYKSETDESDYFPSPSKSKRKKENKKSGKKCKEKDSKLKKGKEENEKRKPLSVTQINTEVKSPQQSKKKDVSTRKKDTSFSEPSPKVPCNAVVSKVSVPAKLCVSPKSNSEMMDSKSKMLFQSPLLKSVNLTPKTPVRIGLRLGLSRKAPLKPLHPNASLK